MEIIMIQEHKFTKDKWATRQILAIEMGWHGVWKAAHITEKGGASGGIATLTRIPILITKGDIVLRYNTQGRRSYTWSTFVGSMKDRKSMRGKINNCRI